MKSLIRFISTALLASMALLGSGSSVWAGGAEHYDFPFDVVDYNDCTDEDVLWLAMIHETYLGKQTPSGQVLSNDHWVWEATLEGQETGFVWTTKGVGAFVETYSLENSLTGGYLGIENSVLHPQTEGAPRILFNANIRFRYNANGDLVVDSAHYEYICIGH